jgi:hypothetical protein
MFPRIRIASGIALTAALVTFITAFAKGGFDFITITGPGLKEAVRVTDASLTEDFFTFANFHEDKTKAPANPGKGYEIARHYVQGQSDIIFDRLHYYPETGFVLYDGIENGDSEYDDEWYIADPEIKTVFAAALTTQSLSAAPVEKEGPVSPVSQSQPAESIAQTKRVEAKFPFFRLPSLYLRSGGVSLRRSDSFWRLACFLNFELHLDLWYCYLCSLQPLFSQVAGLSLPWMICRRMLLPGNR